jgi:hexosaminidase
MLHLVPLLALTAFIAPANVAALWPVPRTLETGSSALRLSSGFSIKINVKGAPSDLTDAVTRSKQLLANDKLEMLVVGRGANNSATVNSAKQLKTLTLSLVGNAKAKSIAEEAVVDITQRSEGYTLQVPADGSDAKLTANS